MGQRALISGITGQTGSYLAEHLIELGYEVHGIVRRTSTPNHDRIKHLINGAPPGRRMYIHQGDLIDPASLTALVAKVKPQEIYNLAAQSFVPASWQQPLLTAEIDALGVTRFLEAIRQVDKSIRFYQASTSEMFGKVDSEPQNETTPFHPRSPYGVAKVYGHYITVNYRESYSMFACCGICFNHESPRRGLEFVTRKITNGVARIKLQQKERLALGNLDAERDWGFAGDYAKAIHLILQQNQADDYVVATGEKHSVREFAQIAFAHVGLDYKDHVSVDQTMFRPAEVTALRGDASKLHRLAGWCPQVNFRQLVEMMVDADLVQCREVTNANC
jgi:GDPmannose 4,6-dehydratase